MGGGRTSVTGKPHVSQCVEIVLPVVHPLFLQLLKKRLTEVLPVMQSTLKDLVKTHGNVSLGSVTIDQAVGGARGVPCILWETSLLNEQTVCCS